MVAQSSRCQPNCHTIDHLRSSGVAEWLLILIVLIRVFGWSSRRLFSLEIRWQAIHVSKTFHGDIFSKFISLVVVTARGINSKGCFAALCGYSHDNGAMVMLLVYIDKSSQSCLSAFLKSYLCLVSY